MKLLLPLAMTIALAVPQVARSQTTFQPTGSPVFVWPELAPDETDNCLGEALPTVTGEDPPITRMVKVRRPTLAVFAPEQPDGTAILILPGGGFGKIVPDMEGSEAAPFLNKLGITVFVLTYRTNESKPKAEPNWLRPLQDAQRAMRWIRANAAAYKLNKSRVGVLGFSAGGQVASILQSPSPQAAYEAIDEIDSQSYRPDFTLLIYPWQVLDPKTNNLLAGIKFNAESPPAFIVHTHDDASSSLGSVAIYAGLKQQNVPAELHIYQTGGHGYGLRPRPHSNISSWPDRASQWLIQNDPGAAHGPMTIR